MKIVLVTGGFDPLHSGHIAYFEAARALGDMLIVGINSDEWLTRKLCVKENGTFLCINDSMDACINITGKELAVFGAVTWTCLPHATKNVRASRL